MNPSNNKSIHSCQHQTNSTRVTLYSWLMLNVRATPIYACKVNFIWSWSLHLPTPAKTAAESPTISRIATGVIIYWTLKAHQADNGCLSLEYSVPWSMHYPFHAVGQWHTSVSYFFFYPPTFINSHLKLLIEIVYHKGRIC